MIRLISRREGTLIEKILHSVQFLSDFSELSEDHVPQTARNFTMENERLAGDTDNPIPLGRCYNGEVLVRWNSRQSLKSTGRIRRRRRFRSQVKSVQCTYGKTRESRRIRRFVMFSKFRRIHRDRRFYNGLIGSVALILALVAVCVPVYYAVLRKYEELL